MTGCQNTAIAIRIESQDDHAAVRKLHVMAFPGPEEADIVDRLREEGDAVISLVATAGDAVVGHVMFSRMTAPFPALGLAPVAVLPDWRRQGIAARLIADGIERARKDNWAGIFVVGDPAYYRRFGFSADRAAKFESPYAGPYLMALALHGGDLPNPSGRIAYAPAFAIGDSI